MKKKAAAFFAAATLTACLSSAVFYSAAFAAREGDLDPSFGDGGRLYSGNPIKGNPINDIATAGDSLYFSLDRVVDTIPDWRAGPNPSPYQARLSISVWAIEKRSLATGALDPAFGKGGIADVMATTSYAGPIATDGQFLYGAGGFLDWYRYFIPQSPSDERVEKFDLKTGALDTRFGAGGILARSKDDCFITDIAAADGFIYVVGAEQDNFDTSLPIEDYVWPKTCVEKRSASTGALDPSFGNGGIVFVESDKNAQAIFAKIKFDKGYVYLFGPGNKYMKKLRESDGAAVPFPVPDPAGEPDIVFDSRSIYTGSGGRLNRDWTIEKRDKQTGALDPAFGKGGVVDEPLGYISVGTMQLDGDSLYVAGDSRVGLGMLQKRSATTGRIDPLFGDGGTIKGELAGAIEGSGKQPHGIPWKFSVIDTGTHALYLGGTEKRLLAGASGVVSGPASAGDLAGAVFSKTLRRGAKNNDVYLLQTLLSSMPDVYPEGLVTGYFGPLTERAVQKFQEKYGIVSSGNPDSTGYGQVGPMTRGKLNELIKTKEGPG